MSRNQCSKIENGSSNNTVGIFDQFFYRIHTYTKQETEKSIKENDFPTRSNSHLTLLLFFFSFLARIPGFLSLVGWSNHCKWVMENLANQPWETPRSKHTKDSLHRNHTALRVCLRKNEPNVIDYGGCTESQRWPWSWWWCCSSRWMGGRTFSVFWLFPASFSWESWMNVVGLSLLFLQFLLLLDSIMFLIANLQFRETESNNRVLILEWLAAELWWAL